MTDRSERGLGTSFALRTRLRGHSYGCIWRASENKHRNRRKFLDVDHRHRVRLLGERQITIHAGKITIEAFFDDLLCGCTGAAMKKSTLIGLCVTLLELISMCRVLDHQTRESSSS